MNFIKNGDIVSRKSYGNDILFYVEDINIIDGKNIATLKGVIVRIEADADISDLVIEDKSRAENEVSKINKRIDEATRVNLKESKFYGKILHLDGDRKYSEKTERYYKKRSLNFVVKHVTESRQPQVVTSLLEKYRPDILVVTGHDGMIKKGKDFNNMNNYRNSKHFYKTVKQARIWNANKKRLSIFAGACQSFYEALISAGANFASSPARILIDFVDPLIVAEQISITSNKELVLMSNLVEKIRNGRRAVDGIGAVRSLQKIPVIQL